MKNQKPKRIPWYQVWRIRFTVNVIVHCLFCLLFGSMFDRLKFWRIKQLLNVWKCTYFSTGDSGRNIQLSQFANFTNRKIVSCFGLPFSVSKIIFFCEFGLAWNRIRINTWAPSLLRLRANLSCCFFFFFYMVVVEYIIESWVVFHLEFTSFTTEMMKMTTVTHGMETLLSTHNQMIQDCSKYMESLKFGLWFGIILVK